MPRRYLKLITCAIMVLITWVVLPGTFIDRGLFSLSVWNFTETPFFITGTGSYESPHTIRTLKKQATTSGEALPDITITDDPDRVFQTAPPSPVDFAIILKNLRRLGRDSVAIGIPLVWQQTDIISLMALDQQLDALPSVVTAAPLSRGAAPSPLPPAFRRASIALSDIRGNTGLLPIVNRLAVPDAILGNKSSLAGFTLLESEPNVELPYLLARWNDRVVLSFTLLTALADHKISPDKIEIRLGNFISFGKDSPFIPIDEFGRLTFAPPSAVNSASIPAETLIDAPDNLLKQRRAGTVLIRQGISSADIFSMRFSETIVSTASLLADPSGTSDSRSFKRFSWLAELFFITMLIYLIHRLENLPITSDRRAVMVLAGVIIIFHFILVTSTDTWPPTLPALFATLTAIPLTARREINSIIKEIPAAQPLPVQQPEFQLEIEHITKPAAKTTTKLAKKKTSKKKAAKKSP